MKRQHRILSQKMPTQRSRKSHIVEENLNRKSQLMDKYQNQIQDLIETMDNKPTHHRKATLGTIGQRKSLQRSRAQSHKKEAILQEGSLGTGAMKDYQKLILGLQYALETQRKKKQSLSHRNLSLQNEISNLRNLLVGPQDKKHYQKNVIRQKQDNITSLQQRLLEQKKNYEFIIDSKNEALATLEIELRTIEKKMKESQKESGMTRKMLDLMSQIEQLKITNVKKNIRIQRYRYHREQMIQDDSDSDQEHQIKQIEKKSLEKKLEFYLQQLEISNKLILRKNIEILNLSNKNLKYDQVLEIIEQYLDKRQVKNIELSILEHPCVNKLRILLRQKAVFEKQLLGQLNQHNKKINNFESELVDRDNSNSSKIIEAINDNKRLVSLVSSLQNNLKNTEVALEDERRENQILKNQIEINKAKFIEEIKKLKEELNTISSVTKNQFDRMKIQNLKLTEQNRSLLFLVGQKQKEIHNKGQAIQVFNDYKDKINSMDVGQKQKRKIDNISEQNPNIGTKLLLVKNFSSWLMEWNKVRNWNNKKVLLNLILDKEQIREDSINSLNYVINVLHECFLSSKSIQIQQRAIILLSFYLKHNIIKNVNFFVDKVSPIILRGFRQIVEGQDKEKHGMLNEATLAITSSLEKNNYRWNNQMTNEMLSVNGLKYLFGILGSSQVDENVEKVYDTLILIAKQNEMISFMNSFNITTMMLKNLTSEYPFIIYVLHLLKTLLQSRDYMRSQKSLLEFRIIFSLIKAEEDEELVDLTLDCALLLMDNTLFTRSVHKIETISILAQVIRNVSDFHILKKIGQVYKLLVDQLETQNIAKFTRVEIQKLLSIINTKKFNETRFNRAVRIILNISQSIVDSNELDQKILNSVIHLYEHYDNIEVKTKTKINNTVNNIFERNKDLVNKYSNQDWIGYLVEAYKSTNVNQQVIFLLRILHFQHEQKRSTEILRTGRQSFIGKLITDSLVPDYNVAIISLKNLLAISKEKYSQKFLTSNQISKLVNKVLMSRNQQEYIGMVVSILYFFSKIEQTSIMVLDAGLLEKIFKVITQRHQKQNLIYRCMSLIELVHSLNYKRKVLNYLLSNDHKLTILKTLNYILKRAKNKKQMGNRCLFIYDYMNGKLAYESLAILIESNVWMIPDLIEVRNSYIDVLDGLVYKIELLLHNMSTINPKVKKHYEKYKVEGGYGSEDD